MPGASKPLPDEQPVIDELVRAGYEYEVDYPGWGFHHLKDDALESVRRLKTIAFLDLFEECDVGGVTDNGMAFLADNRSLVCLRLGPGITDAGLAHLYDLTQLEELRLDSAKDVSDNGMKCLSGLVNLQVLSVQFTQVGDAGLEHLVGLSQLNELALDYTQVTNAGLRHLAGMTRLTTLHVSGTAVTAHGVRGFKATHPQCKVLT